jgi:hypothetical protein
MAGLPAGECVAEEDAAAALAIMSEAANTDLVDDGDAVMEKEDAIEYEKDSGGVSVRRSGRQGKGKTKLRGTHDVVHKPLLNRVKGTKAKKFQRTPIEKSRANHERAGPYDR